ncbi:unnamed protein product [Paramecium pentaurelia]|uniref:AAA+ ATPase domain-containing protein n=1 Tax=Paramecium pentaurelia TaxID=43138 RepID=A0A8S1S576_9CILI|nr:unnamed protein product [Paramecium pentaurelia]
MWNSIKQALNGDKKQNNKSRSPTKNCRIQKQEAQISQIDPNLQIKNAQKMIELGMKYFENQQYSMAKVVLVNSSQILLPVIKQKKLNQEEHQNEYQQLIKAINTAINTAEICTKKVEQIQQSLASQDPYSKQIIETAMIRKCDVSFDQIIGLESIKNQLEEVIVLPNLRPDIFTGIRAPPKGILFYGPPGNGKTLLAKAVANQIKCCFFNVSASTLVQKHLGEGEKLMKTLFKVAFQFQPSVIFIDEIDSILSSRSSEEHEASRRLKTEFLVSFDGMQTTDQDRIFLIAATNRPQDIDGAVLRRFNVKILIDQPDQKARLGLVRSLMSKVNHSILDPALDKICEKLAGYSASDIKAVVKEACMQPLREDKNAIVAMSAQNIRPVRKEDFEFAINKVKPSLTQKQYQEYISFNKSAQ